jgi:quinol monooxygenase YgiN
VDSDPQLIEPQDKQTVFINFTRISVKPEKRKELYQTIMPLLDPIRREKGCLTCNFYSDVGDSCESLLLGEWESETDLNEHLKSAHFALLSAAISVLAKQETTESRVLTDSELLTD